ncbi:MAG TPA: inositol monophosphatase family protein [Kofleriaceae bacterium]|nr:inositol monophosphatase family protein [Kofleriaceae bacterium]
MSAEALEIARAVAGEAAALVRGAIDNVGTIRSKSNPRDLVTEWDTRTEDLIRGRLQVLSPGIPILGEEAGASGEPGGSTSRWLIDPIDGTVNFSHGLPLFGVVLALEEHGQPTVGVVIAPALGWEFYGRSGGGAFFGDRDGERRLEVSRVTSLDRAMLATGFPYDRATNPDNNFRQWEHFQRHAGACRRLGAASLDLCLVARGWLDGYWESRLKPWDLAAGALLVREAGGQVTGIDGGPFASDSGHAIASNGAIHKGILEQLAAVDSGTS